MKEKGLKKWHLLTGGTIGILGGLILFIVLNAYFSDSFRTMQDKISASEKVELTGLRELQASGGDLPRFQSLKIRLGFVTSDPVIILNAESEPMEYVHGLPISILGYRGKVPEFKHYLRRLLFVNSLEVPLSAVASESEEAKKHGFGYANLVIHSRSATPDKNVDDLVAFFDKLPENVWLHIHCHHGEGRTTMILSMLDIMRNAPAVSLANIVKRQYLLGTVDLFNTVEWKKGSYTKQQLETRKKFIEDFYTFIVQRKSGGIQRWSEWAHQNRGSERVS